MATSIEIFNRYGERRTLKKTSFSRLKSGHRQHQRQTSCRVRSSPDLQPWLISSVILFAAINSYCLMTSLLEQPSSSSPSTSLPLTTLPSTLVKSSNKCTFNVTSSSYNGQQSRYISLSTSTPPNEHIESLKNPLAPITVCSAILGHFTRIDVTHRCRLWLAMRAIIQSLAQADPLATVCLEQVNDVKRLRDFIANDGRALKIAQCLMSTSESMAKALKPKARSRDLLQTTINIITEFSMQFQDTLMVAVHDHLRSLLANDVKSGLEVVNVWLALPVFDRTDIESNFSDLRELFDFIICDHHLNN